MALGVKESVSGKLYRLETDGVEERVCGGKGAVYLSGPKIALRCCGKTSIVATRQAKQSVLRQGDVLLLGIRDTFYANGTLTKYEVVDTDAVPSKLALHVLPTRVPSIIMSSAASGSYKYRAKPASTPQFVSSYLARRSESPSRAIHEKKDCKVKLTGSSLAEDADEEEDELAPTTRRRGKRTRAIIESDDETETSSLMTQEPSVLSPQEDDVFEKDFKPSTSAATDWMAAFGRNGVKKTSSISNGTMSGGWKRRPKDKEYVNRTKFATPRRVSYHDEFDESDEDVHFSRSHDEVGQLLKECEMIASKLRQSVRNWSGNSAKATSSSPSTSPGDATDEEEALHMSLASIQSGDRRVVSQTDIPDISETLELKPYQVVGINWLLLLHENKVSGVLADEMGLGKTVQTIAFLALLKSMKQSDKSKVEPHLVIVPASVLDNWTREFAWIAPTLRIVTYHGSQNYRRELEDTLNSDDIDVLLTTYTYFERDTCQVERAFLQSFNFEYLILDEGHSIKNSKTSRFKRITALRVRTRLVLSGTPIQNKLKELLTMLSFLMPRMFDHGSDELLSFFDGSEEKKCEKVRKILAPFILRREKKYVLSQLVPKTVVVELLKAGEEQRKAYTDLLDSVVRRREALAAYKAAVKERKKKKSKDDKADRQLRDLIEPYSAKPENEPSVMSIFTQLRKAANHPMLLRRHFVSDKVLDTMSRCLHRAEAFGNQCSISLVRQELESSSDFELHDLCVQYAAIDELRQLQLPTETLCASVKFEYLRTLLPQLQKEGHRVLIFSQWTKLLDLLEVNGDENIFVFLLSTRAGGLGINLTAADTVILHDLDFNPTADEQACDRCHRIGQTKPVSIYKLVSEGTVDEDIYKLGVSKTELNHKILDKLNAHSDGVKKVKKSDAVTVEMLLASVISDYKSAQLGT